MKSLVKKLINSSKIASTERDSLSGKKIYSLTINIQVKVIRSCKKIEVWIALPRETKNQKILRSSFSKPKPEVIKDSVFGNEVAYWIVANPDVGRILKFSENSEIKVKPDISERIKGMLESYEKDDYFYKLYTKEDHYFNFSDERIQTLAKELMGNERVVEKIARKFYGYVRDNISYGKPIEGLYTSIDALESDVVDCGGYDCLLGALLRSVGIPARLVAGILAGYPGEHMHAWMEFMLPDGSWVPADASTEKLRLEKRDFKPGAFGKVGNDRIILSYGTNITVSKKTFPLLQLPVIESDPANSVEVERKIEATNTIK